MNLQEKKRRPIKFAIEGRKRIKDQLMRLDTTYADVKFSYKDKSGKIYYVKTLEEIQYPQYYATDDNSLDEETNINTKDISPDTILQESELKEQHLTFQENQRGISYDSIFGPYLKDVTKLTITDPYIRIFYQIRNLMEFLETIIKNKHDEDEIAVHLITVEDEFKNIQQQEYLEKIKISSSTVGLSLTYEFVDSSKIHARHILTNQGWKILLDRGLDIYQHYEMNDAFNFANRLQKLRSCKAFEVTFLKNKEENN
ncbi:ATP-dependent Lon protease [Candidatus Magnetomorum sp. HK-1]|nr:ATP-dependent Lon protease [Candidatus Magnetomorum sp. HK-1]